jgi:hypothetical protein
MSDPQSNRRDFTSMDGALLVEREFSRLLSRPPIGPSQRRTGGRGIDI